MQELRLDHSTDAATRVALTRNDIAHQSVQALLDDLAHVTTRLPVLDRAAAARAVLEHHRPPVNEALLSEEGRRLQSAARAALQQLAESGTEQIQTFDDVLVAPNTPATPTVRSAGRVRSSGTVRSSGNMLRQWGITLGMTGAIATGGFAIGALLQRLL